MHRRIPELAPFAYLGKVSCRRCSQGRIINEAFHEGSKYNCKKSVLIHLLNRLNAFK